MALSMLDWLVTGACHVVGVPFRLFNQRQELTPPQRLLILKTCCIGDVLLATPVVAALQRAFPGVRVDWAVSAWARPLVATNLRLGKILNAGNVGAGGWRWSEVRKLVGRIQAEEYDTCLVLDRSPMMALIPWLAGVPQRIGLDSRGRGFLHHVRVPVEGVRHEAEIYLDVARAMGVGPQGVQTEFYPTEQDRAAAAQFLEQRLQWSGDEPLFVVHPAGGRNPGMKMISKRWPPERYALLVNRLLKHYGGKALLLGGPQDKVLLDAVSGLVPGGCVAAAGEVDWGVWGAILEMAALCVGNDTGATHLAVAVGCKTIFVFGPSDPRRYGPYARPGQAAALWHPIPGLVNGVSGGVPPDWSWDDGVKADEAWHAARSLLSADDDQGEEEE